MNRTLSLVLSFTGCLMMSNTVNAYMTRLIAINYCGFTMLMAKMELRLYEKKRINIETRNLVLLSVLFTDI